MFIKVEKDVKRISGKDMFTYTDRQTERTKYAMFAIVNGELQSEKRQNNKKLVK